MRAQLVTFSLALGLVLRAPWQTAWSVRLGGVLPTVASLLLWGNLIGAVRLFRREARPRGAVAGG